MKRTPLLVLLALAASCAAPVALVGIGAVAGVWTYDSFTDDRGEMLLAAPPERVFEVAEQVVRSRPGAADVRVVRGSYRIEYTEQDKVQVVIQVLIVPGSQDYAKLKVYAAEFGVRGRADVAKEVAEEIAARL